MAYEAGQDKSMNYALLFPKRLFENEIFFDNYDFNTIMSIY